MNKKEPGSEFRDRENGNVPNTQSVLYVCFFNANRTKVFLNYGQVKQLNC